MENKLGTTNSKWVLRLAPVGGFIALPASYILTCYTVDSLGTKYGKQGRKVETFILGTLFVTAFDAITLCGAVLAMREARNIYYSKGTLIYGEKVHTCLWSRVKYGAVLSFFTASSCTFVGACWQGP